MMMCFRRSVFSTTAASVIGLVVSILSVEAATLLITTDEARLPDNGVRRRAIFLGPIIQVSARSSAGVHLKSPIHFKVTFQTRLGANIDLDSLSVTYQRLPPQDLTSRVLPFSSNAGIDIPDAEVPPGKHRIWVEVKDTNGDSGWGEVILDVSK
jgi:hypothetical protein